MFCIHCGSQVAETARFCPSCGMEREIEEPARQTAEPGPAPVSSGSAAGAPRKKGFPVLLLAVSVMLIFIGCGYLALSAVGKTVTAQVTGYEQVYILNNDDSTRDPNRYKLSYAFTVDGEMYDGSVTRSFKGGGQTLKTLQVRYLPFWPHINAEDGGGTGVAGPAALGLGAVVFLFGVKKKSQR